MSAQSRGSRRTSQLIAVTAESREKIKYKPGMRRERNDRYCYCDLDPRQYTRVFASILDRTNLTRRLIPPCAFEPLSSDAIR